jgi:hypothetical protein
LAAARLVNSLTASIRGVISEIGCPNDLVQAICFLGLGASSKLMHASPCNSLTVRSNTTLQRSRTKDGLNLARSRTVITPATKLQSHASQLASSGSLVLESEFVGVIQR